MGVAMDIMATAMAATVTAMDTMARGKPRLLLLLSLAMATMVDMVATAMVTDMADTDTMATTARGRLSQLLLLLLSQQLLPSLAMDTMAMADMVTMAIMARGLLMLMPTTVTEDTEDTAMDMVMAMATSARDLLTPTTAMEDMEDMVTGTVMVTVMAMATDTTDKIKEDRDDVKIEFSGYTMKWIYKKSSHEILLFAKEIHERTC